MRNKRFHITRLLLLKDISFFDENLLLRLSPEHHDHDYTYFLKSLKQYEEHGDMENRVTRESDAQLIKSAFDLLYETDLESLKLKADIETNIQNYNGTTESSIPDTLSERATLRWARKLSWTTRQATMLSIGIVPSPLTDYKEPGEEAYFPLIGFGFLDEYRERKNLLGEYFRETQSIDASPGNYLNWFERMRFSFPIQLKKSVLQIHGPLQTFDEKELSSTERTTLIRMVAAMAVRGYGFVPEAKRNKATADIVADLDFLGAGLDPKTVLKWIRIGLKELNEDANP